MLGCSLASVYNWAAAWQQQGQAGLAEAKHAGRTRTLDAEALHLLEHWLEADPQTLGEQTTGWTVPLLHTRLTQAGYSISQRTLRRALHRLGWRWKRPKYVLGRPDPAYEEKKGALVARVQQALAEGKEVWIGDETTLREFPPLRAAWAKRGQQQVVVIRGRNGRRVLHGALNIQTGELVRLGRERSRTDDSQVFVETLGKLRPEVPKLLISRQRAAPSSQAGKRSRSREDRAGLVALSLAGTQPLRGPLAAAQSGDCGQPGVWLLGGRGRASSGLARRPHQRGAVAVLWPGNF